MTVARTATHTHIVTTNRQSTPLTALTPDEHVIAAALRRHVVAIADTPRNLWHYESLQHAAAYIDGEFTRAGYQPRHQVYEVEGRRVANIEAERLGNRRSDRILVIGAHYDSIADSPGANDNASGVAVMLELARMHAVSAAPLTVRFVAFANEEPPYFMTAAMGSFTYAAEAAARGDDIVAMMSLETIGYYSDASGSQRYPRPFNLILPNRGNFLAMVSNIGSVRALRTASKAFRSATRLPLIASPAPTSIPGVAWSDHWSFWRHGYRAMMLTDTAAVAQEQSRLTFPQLIVARARGTMEEILDAAIGGDEPEPFVSNQPFDRAVHARHIRPLAVARRIHRRPQTVDAGFGPCIYFARAACPFGVLSAWSSPANSSYRRPCRRTTSSTASWRRPLEAMSPLFRRSSRPVVKSSGRPSRSVTRPPASSTSSDPAA